MGSVKVPEASKGSTPVHLLLTSFGTRTRAEGVVSAQFVLLRCRGLSSTGALVGDDNDWTLRAYRWYDASLLEALALVVWEHAARKLFSEGQRLGGSEGSSDLPPPVAMDAVKDSCNPPQTPIRPKRFLTRRINDIAESLISPSDVLQIERQTSQPKPARATPRTPHVMDKRHPSSFQQLEKVIRDQQSLMARIVRANAICSLGRARMPL